jgi:outer membrane receptor protein involved in Fe transport
MSKISTRARAGALATTSAFALCFALAGGSASQAQEGGGDKAEAPPTAPIVITGSRIQRRDYVANSPIVTVESQQLEQQSGVNVESYLNQLPQFNPAAAPTVLAGSGSNSDVQPTATNSVGIATVSLRGLGSNRNLVLVDGHRLVPINASMQTDLNSIPSAMIQRVETITGGASTVYGADAVGGVVNFILKKDFDGVELDTRYSTTQVGDGQEFTISGLMGANSPDGRGNITLGLEEYQRTAALQNKRDFFTNSWSNPYIGTNEFFTVTHGYSAIAGNIPTTNAIKAVLPNAQGTICSNCATDYNFNPDGTIWVNGNGSYTFPATLVDGKHYAYQNIYDPTVPGRIIQTIKSNNQFDYASSPQTRYSIFTTGHYKLTDDVEFYGRGSFEQSDTTTRLFPSPAITGWAVEIPYNPEIDSPINPHFFDGSGTTYATATQAQLQQALLSTNPSFRPEGSANAHFPVTPDLALLLNSRNQAATFCNPTAQFGQNFTCLGSNGLRKAGVLPTEEASLWGNPVGNQSPWQLKFIPDDWFADRSTVDRTTVWQVEAGLRGPLHFKDWNWDLLVSHGESSTYNINNGNFSLQRLQGMIAGTDIPITGGPSAGLPAVTMNSYWDYGRNAVITGNQGTPNAGFGAATATCTSGFYNTIFGGDVPPSKNCADGINAILQGSTRSDQTIAELNIQGTVIDLPAGPVRTAAGVQYRENGVKYTPDILQSTSSFIDQVVGVYPTAYMDAATYSLEGYDEALVPVLSDLPLVKKLELELGFRYSTYAKSSNEWTYKALAHWTVTDWLYLRGGYNRATRAPNIGELFLGDQQFFGAGGAYGDPCGLRSTAPFGAGGVTVDPDTGLPVVDKNPALNPAVNLAPGQTAAGAASTFLICKALMTPTGANTFYNVAFQPPGGGGGFAFLRQKGNANLESEQGDTFTAGAVISSPFKNPWVKNLKATVDWYRLEVSNAIQQQTVDQARFGCYGQTIVHTLAEAQAWVATGACDNTGRRQSDGAELNTLVSYSNQAHIETSGVDVSANWSAQLADLGLGKLPGGVSAGVQASFLDSYKTKASTAAFDLDTEWKGTMGPLLSGTNSGAYNYRVFTNVGYFAGPGSIQLRWRHYPEVYQAGIATQRATIANNEAVANGAPGLMLGWTPSTAVKLKKYDIFDLSGTWQLNDRVMVSAGIDNLLDASPIRTAETAGYPYDPSKTLADNQAVLAHVCQSMGFAGDNPAPGQPLPVTRRGCTNPAGFSLPGPSLGTTSGGYYDLLGRRFFVGLKLNF